MVVGGGGGGGWGGGYQRAPKNFGCDTIPG